VSDSILEGIVFVKERLLLSSPTMHSEEMAFIKDAFEKNWIAPLGLNCDNFEKEIGEYIKFGLDEDFYCLSLNSGTSALHLAVKLAGVKPGDIVLCSDMTFAATVNPISYEGGIQVFIDSERESWNLDPEALEKAFQKYPTAKVVMLAHLYGTPSKMDEIVEICKRHNAILIEDAAEALASTYKGRKCGTFGKYNVFSFNGNKIITTSGGGMLITRSAKDRNKAFYWATQSREPAPWYQHEELGYNYRMSNIVAGIGRGQLLHIGEHQSLKKQIYNRYKEGFKDLPLQMNPYLAESEPNFWLSCILLDKSLKLSPMDIFYRLEEENIESRPLWKPMHLQPVFKKNDFITVGDEAVNEDLFSRGLCLPSDIKMTKEQQDTVISIITDMVKKAL
jgi:dTDP-4-amino-4,6-dideoxygalactose transaminase